MTKKWLFEVQPGDIPIQSSLPNMHELINGLRRLRDETTQREYRAHYGTAGRKIEAGPNAFG
ncbi:MAG: hypothetical protein Tsb009_22780 [Planctomycetaceae bacterium]